MPDPVARWLLLIHQIPPVPAYLRVKVGRRLARMGAVALKNSVYVLPRSEGGVEDFQWVRREIVESGGDATIVDAQLVDGLSEAQVEDLFRSARDADYDALVAEARASSKQIKGRLSSEKRQQLEADIARLERRIADVVAVDFFHAPGRARAQAALRGLRDRLDPQEPAARRASPPQSRFHECTWVTRAGVHVDRIASAWLIRRFIDSAARFKLVPAKGYTPEPGELRFDMFEAEFSHEGDSCTFEVLCQRFALEEPGLQAIAEVVHDIDLKDAKFGRPETDGVAAQIAGIALCYRDDDARLEHGSELCEQLLAYFSRRKSEQARTPLQPGKRVKQ